LDRFFCPCINYCVNSDNIYTLERVFLPFENIYDFCRILGPKLHEFFEHIYPASNSKLSRSMHLKIGNSWCFLRKIPHKSMYFQNQENIFCWKADFIFIFFFKLLYMKHLYHGIKIPHVTLTFSQNSLFFNITYILIDLFVPPIIIGGNSDRILYTFVSACCVVTRI